MFDSVLASLGLLSLLFKITQLLSFRRMTYQLGSIQGLFQAKNNYTSCQNVLGPLMKLPLLTAQCTVVVVVSNARSNLVQRNECY